MHAIWTSVLIYSEGLWSNIGINILDRSAAKCYKKMLLCSVLSVHLTSSKSLVGIAGVISEIQKEKKVSDQLKACIVISFFVLPD